MEKMIFKKQDPKSKGPKTAVVRVSRENYDKVIVTDDMDCPIDENSVLFVDREPETSLDGDLLYDYVVRRVSKSLNYISIAISKVRVS